MVQHLLDICDQVGGDQHGRIFAVVGKDRPQDIIPGCRVHAADRFVQDIEVCIPAHYEDELYFLLGALAPLESAFRRLLLSISSASSIFSARSVLKFR